MLLEARDLTVRYGAVRALEKVSFNVDKGEIVAMIGPNGAGKSTALNAVSGVLYAKGGTIESGDIFFDGESIKNVRTDLLVKKGISLVPEGRRIFPTMTVWENLEMGAYIIRDKKVVATEIDRVLTLLPQLKDRTQQKAGTLSTGEQQMLALGRALMLKPKLLMADEPSLGLSPNYVDLIFEKLIDINRNGTSILLVEQNARMALEVCHRGYVFRIGTIALEGKQTSLLEDERVQNMFLGEMMKTSLEEKQTEFFSGHWIESRHDFLKTLPLSEAKELVESLVEDDISYNVNARKFQEAYICDYLEDLWSISPTSFWEHIRLSLIHPDGVLISDNDFHLDIMSTENMPWEVWITLLETLIFAKRDLFELTTFNVIKAQTTASQQCERMQKELIDWVNSIDDYGKDHLRYTLEQLEETYHEEVPNLDQTFRPAILASLREIFHGAVPAWLEGVLEND